VTVRVLTWMQWDIAALRSSRVHLVNKYIHELAHVIGSTVITATASKLQPCLPPFLKLAPPCNSNQALQAGSE